MFEFASLTLLFIVFALAGLSLAKTLLALQSRRIVRRLTRQVRAHLHKKRVLRCPSDRRFG